MKTEIKNKSNDTIENMACEIMAIWLDVKPSEIKNKFINKG